MHRRPAEESGAKFRVPADVVPPAHLLFEESRQHQALGAGGFHHDAVLPQSGVRNEMIEDRAEIRRRREIDGGVRGHLGVVRQHAGVVEQLRLIYVGSGHILQALEEEFQRLTMIGREQLPQRTHSS